ncbi:chondroitin AC/alginate lyase [Setomelanomma holmii]|uniref:Chondroitin AC/alginate lyase n=1 Tax=Setomelanomma holmii TaxID=210430 RepID=A0A9P4LSG7_9PLEO|nr:chondroitin AC/alginate lyase [Setomelanomma holmii]
MQMHFLLPSIKHPDALHSAADNSGVKGHVQAKDEPWYSAYEHLTTLKLAQTPWNASPQGILVRGSPDPNLGLPENYQHAYSDAHSAYQQALRWLLTGDTSFADAAVKTLNGWGFTLYNVSGNEDRFLTTGFYGYQLANAAELMPSYSGWSSSDQKKFGTMLNNVFAKNNTVAYGALPYFSIANFTEDGSGKELMQGQEAGRDQGHALLCMVMLGVTGQQGANQGVDLFGAYGNEILTAAEYAAKYNIVHDVPFKVYDTYEGTEVCYWSSFRYDIRPGFETLYAHYADVKGMNASWMKFFRDYVNANLTINMKGGGGDYDPNSGVSMHLGLRLICRVSGN